MQNILYYGTEGVCTSMDDGRDNTRMGNFIGSLRIALFSGHSV